MFARFRLADFLHPRNRKEHLLINSTGKYHDYNFYRVSGKGKGEAESISQNSINQDAADAVRTSPHPTRYQLSRLKREANPVKGVIG